MRLISRPSLLQQHSERVPNKNFRLLAGRPLYCWTLSALLGSSQISRIVIDTDCETLERQVAAHFPSGKDRITVRRGAVACCRRVLRACAARYCRDRRRFEATWCR